MTDFHKMLLGAFISVIIGAFSGYFSARQESAIQVNRIEERQKNNYDEIVRAIGDLKGDLQGVRAEILGILRSNR